MGRLRDPFDTVRRGGRPHTEPEGGSHGIDRADSVPTLPTDGDREGACGIEPNRGRDHLGEGTDSFRVAPAGVGAVAQMLPAARVLPNARRDPRGRPPSRPPLPRPEGGCGADAWGTNCYDATGPGAE